MKDVNVVLTKEQSAYLAGLVDGEGCLDFYKTSNKSCTRGFTFVARMTITNTNLEALISIAQEIGIGKITKKPRDGNKRKDAYNLFYSPREVRVLLPFIIPYLRMKKKQAELLLNFLGQSHWGKNGQGKGLTDKQVSDRENLFQEMRKLNQRGVLIREQ